MHELELFQVEKTYRDKIAVENLEAVFSENTVAAFEEAADLIIASKRKYIVASRGWCAAS